MATQRKNKTPPASPINAWVKEAIDSAGLSYQSIADEMTRSGIGAYDRSKVQKMTVGRGVSAEEAAAIATITGYALPSAYSGDRFETDFERLSESDREIVRAMIHRMLKATET